MYMLACGLAVEANLLSIKKLMTCVNIIIMHVIYW